MNNDDHASLHETRSASLIEAMTLAERVTLLYVQRF
jgi:hypothetical protein